MNFAQIYDLKAKFSVPSDSEVHLFFSTGVRLIQMTKSLFTILFLNMTFEVFHDLIIREV